MRLALAVVFLFTAAPAAACHVFSRWWYPYPQRCAPRTHVDFSALKRGVKNRHDTDIPLPDLTWPGAGPEPDADTRARLLLHAAFDKGGSQ